MIKRLSVVCVLLLGCGGSTGNNLFGGSDITGGQGSASNAGGAVSGPGGTTNSAGGDAANAGGATDDAGGSTSSAGGASNSGGSSFGEGGFVAASGGSVGSTGGATPLGGPDAGPVPCATDAKEVCTCAAITGSRTCANGVFGACVCPACQDGVDSPCSCPNGSPGEAKCSGGVLSACTGCPIAPSGCPVGMTCAAAGGSASSTEYYCANKGAILAPSCKSDAECATLNVSCFFLPILGGECLKGCTP